MHRTTYQRHIPALASPERAYVAPHLDRFAAKYPTTLAHIVGCLRAPFSR